MSRRGIAVLLAAVVLSGCAATPSASARVAPSAHSLGKVLTKIERQAYRCGRFRENRPVRAFVTKPHERFRLIPRRLLRTRRHVVLRCAFARPHAVRVTPGAVQAAPAPAPVVPTPAPVQAAPVAAPAPVASTCRDEIGDPAQVPFTSGLRPVNEMDVYDPFPDDLAETDPMQRWTNPDFGLSVSDAGHVLVTIDGQQYTHPVASAQFALASVREYGKTGDPVWLDRAVTSFGDPLATITPGGQIPQNYPWRGPEGNYLTPGGFSALTQGQSLSLAVRLYRATGEHRWRDLADELFATLATPGTESPSVTFIDTSGYLWFEEFPMECPSRVWNGHVYATFAMADYYRLTGNERALELFDAGATTALHYMPQIRVPGGLANYCVSHAHHVSLAYHRMMTVQLRYLAEITGNSAFSDWADLLAQDAS